MHFAWFKEVHVLTKGFFPHFYDNEHRCDALYEAVIILESHWDQQDCDNIEITFSKNQKVTFLVLVPLMVKIQVINESLIEIYYIWDVDQAM